MTDLTGDGDVAELVRTVVEECWSDDAGIQRLSSLAGAFTTWRATRRADGSAVSGFGAYHCRIVDGLIREDWDVFYPLA
jgi:hypothetical protein